MALAALKLHERGLPRPVKTIRTREEYILAHCKRHSFREVTEQCALAAGWTMMRLSQDEGRKTMENGSAEIGRAGIRHGASKVGMGSHTVITQMAADALGISMDQVELVSSDTADVKDAGGSIRIPHDLLYRECN